jgi:quercetin dioxygenase-like cupin family protein
MRSTATARTEHIVSIDYDDLNAHPGERVTQLLFGSFADRRAETVVVVSTKLGPDQPEDHPFHTHDFDQLIFIFEGRLMAQVEGEEPYEMVPGDMAMWPPGLSHRNWVDAEERCVMLSMDLHPH